ncbi:hypothetical protein [Streptomyces sp. NPDC026589]|uniref:MmyB family transcriptional regulator n=1 Tax=Streptomyces sp. NPDC026589 TaxID=3155609 RepID=UPI0033DDC3EE
MRWLLDSVTLSAAFVRNGRMDVVAANPRRWPAPCTRRCSTAKPSTNGAAPTSPASTSATRARWTSSSTGTPRPCHRLLRAEPGREPHDRALRELIGELSTLSPEFRTMWAAHDVGIQHGGIKRLEHPDVGRLELTYQSLDLPTPNRTVHGLNLYTAEPGTPSEDRLKLLASLAATRSQEAEPTDQLR